MLWLVLGCGVAERPGVAVAEPVATEPVATEDLGARVFATHCAACHGEAGAGDGPAAAGLTPPPRDLSRPRAAEERHPPSRAEVIADGKAGTAMPGFRDALTPAELAAVQAWVHRLAHGDGALPGPGGMGPGR